MEALQVLGITSDVLHLQAVARGGGGGGAYQCQRLAVQPRPQNKRVAPDSLGQRVPCATTCSSSSSSSSTSRSRSSRDSFKLLVGLAMLGVDDECRAVCGGAVGNVDDKAVGLREQVLVPVPARWVVACERGEKEGRRRRGRRRKKEEWRR